MNESRPDPSSPESLLLVTDEEPLDVHLLEITLRNLIRMPTIRMFMKQLFEYRVVSGDLEVQIDEMAREGWRFVWAGQYDLLPYMVFEKRLEE